MVISQCRRIARWLACRGVSWWQRRRLQPGVDLEHGDLPDRQKHWPKYSSGGTLGDEAVKAICDGRRGWSAIKGGETTVSIVVFNTLSGKKETFVELNAGRVTMYTCGPTVYDFFHIGNARCFVIHDVIRRYFRYCGYDVTYVQNFTDIDDKMIKRAAEKGISVSELAERFITAYFEDADALGIERADIHPRATEHIPEMISLVERLIANGHAYEVDGDVYYSVSSFADYGKLSHQHLEDLQAGSRSMWMNENNTHLILLFGKTSQVNRFWDSPWGMGRPGWHLNAPPCQ